MPVSQNRMQKTCWRPSMLLLLMHRSFGNRASLWPYLVHGDSTLFIGWAYPLLNTRRLQNILYYAPFRKLLQNLTPFIFWVSPRTKFGSWMPRSEEHTSELQSR